MPALQDFIENEERGSEWSTQHSTIHKNNKLIIKMCMFSLSASTDMHIKYLFVVLPCFSHKQKGKILIRTCSIDTN